MLSPMKPLKKLDLLPTRVVEIRPKVDISTNKVKELE